MNRWDGYGELYHHGITGQKWGVEAALTAANLSLKAGMMAGILSGGNPAVAITTAALSEIGNVAVSKWIGDKQYDFVKKHSNLSFA